MRQHTLSVLGCLLLIAPVTCFAQKRGESPASPSVRRDAILSREADIQNRELRLRLLNEVRSTTPTSADDRKLIVNQIFEDFERLQIANREMMRTSSTLNTTSYKQISSLAGEINKRAKRLKTNLGVPDLGQKPKETEPVPEMDVPHLKDLLQALNVSVKSFVTNPLFKDPRVTDVNHLTNLRRDIFNVIELSHTVKKNVVKLH